MLNLKVNTYYWHLEIILLFSLLGIVWPYYMGKHVNYREAIKSNVDPLKITFYLATLDGFVSRRDRPTDVSLLSLGSNSTTTTRLLLLLVLVVRGEAARQVCNVWVWLGCVVLFLKWIYLRLMLWCAEELKLLGFEWEISFTVANHRYMWAYPNLINLYQKFKWLH